MQAIETTLYKLLQTQLKEQLSDQSQVLVQPFLAQAEDALLGRGNLVQSSR